MYIIVNVCLFIFLNTIYIGIGSFKKEIIQEVGIFTYEVFISQ